LVEKDFTRSFKLTWVLYSLSTNNEYYLKNKTSIEKVNIGSIGPIFEYDKRDHPFVTRKGFYTRLAIEYSHPDLASSSGVHFVRNTAQVNTYVPMKLLNTVWATQVGGGYLKNTENSRVSDSTVRESESVPDIKTFKLGGRDTLRGYEPNEIPGTTDKNGKYVNVTDDSYYYLVKSEFRIPVYGQIESVLFYDGGLVYVRGNEFKYPYRDSVGVGFRYQTPVGPLSFEYGQKLERSRVDESRGRVHISFGTF
jgi:outer membrane protein assembly factor BamA